MKILLLNFIVVIISLVFFSSCKKDRGASCFSSAATVQQLTNDSATVIFSEGQYYLVQRHTIDSRLKPCSLPAEFRVDHLSVVISGEIKKTNYSGQTICCTEDFVLREIHQ